MRKNIFNSLVLLAGSLSLSTVVLAQGDNIIAEANNQFAFKLYGAYKSKDGNIFFSPYSIFSALAMTYEGARGKTADEMLSVFGFPKDDSLRRKILLKLNNNINKKGKKYKLSTANALWAQKDYKFLDNYFKLIDQYYGANVTNLDFGAKVEESRETINQWVEKKTDNKIKNLIPQGAIDPLTRLILTNAIYFKGIWADKFDKSATSEKGFRTKPDNIVKVQMMNQNKRFNYAETDALQILEIPYQDNELSILILLPKKDEIKTLEDSLTFEKLSEYKKILKNEEVDVSIPRFKFETKYEIKDDLARMGMPTAFSLRAADFSGMTGKQDLYIGRVIHQAFVEVNEEGTEAAGATAVLMEANGMEISRMFNADHPFIFFIQEKETGVILFMGRVSDPI